MMLENEQQKNIRYGFFEVIHPSIPEKDLWQIADVNGFNMALDTGDTRTPYCVYLLNIDAEMQARGVTPTIAMHGGATLNGKSQFKNSNADIKPYTSPEATYVRFNSTTRSIEFTVPQWHDILCGNWMWIAFYDE